MSTSNDYNNELEEEITEDNLDDIDDGYGEEEKKSELSNAYDTIQDARDLYDHLKKKPKTDKTSKDKEEDREPRGESEPAEDKQIGQASDKELEIDFEKGDKLADDSQPAKRSDDIPGKEASKSEPTSAKAKGGTPGDKAAPGELKGKVGRPIGTPKTPPAGGAGGTGASAGTAGGGTAAATSGAGTTGGAATAGGAGAAAGGAGAAGGATAAGATAWWVILIIAIILIIFALLLFVIGLIVGFFAGGSSSDSAVDISSVPIGQLVGGVENTIPYPSGCDEQAMVRSINSFIDKYASRSPLRGQGHLFVNAGREGGINPFFIAAQANKENQFATTGYAINHPSSHNTFGHKYGAWTKDYGIKGGKSPEGNHYMSYPDWESSLRAHTNIISHYINDRGKRTLLEIIDYYTTGNEVLYTQQVNRWMSEMFANAGCGPLSADASTVPGTPVSNSSIESIISDSGFSSDEVSYAVSGGSGSTSGNGDRMMPSASSIKASILLAYLYNNNVPSKGGGMDSTIDKMITHSNNESSNQIISSIGGIGQVSSILASHGITGVALNRNFGAGGSEDNLISANGAIATLRAITELPPEKREYALSKLYRGDTGSGQDYIRKSLTGATVYSKSGQGLNNSARNDIAIIKNGNNYSFIAVLVKTNSDNTAKAQALIGEIAKRGITIADVNASINCY